MNCNSNYVPKIRKKKHQNEKRMNLCFVSIVFFFIPLLTHQPTNQPTLKCGKLIKQITKCCKENKCTKN